MATKGRIQYTVSAGNRIGVPDYDMGGSNATEITGFTIIDNEGYCLKENAAGNKSTLFRFKEINSDQAAKRGQKVLNYGTYGMTYNGNFVYIAAKGSKVIKTSAVSDKDTPVVYSVKADGKAANTQAITHYTGNQFILMANALNSGNYLCFLVGTFSDDTNKFVENDRFYVRNTSGNTQLQDIHYESKVGLLITTNKMSGSNFGTSSTILRAEIDLDTDESRNGYPLYHPTAEYVFTALAGRYNRLNVESIAFSTNGKLYMAANTEPSGNSGTFKTGGIFFINNITFGKTQPTLIDLKGSEGIPIAAASVDDNGTKRDCGNPGSLALNGNIGYCLRTHGKSGSPLQDKGSVLLSCSNVTNTSDSNKFTRVSGSPDLINMMGHGNGMTYKDGYLYIAAHSKSTTPNIKNIVKITTKGTNPEIFDCTKMLGGIACYNDKEFIALDYKTSPNPYAMYPTFHIGELKNGNFEIRRTFCVKNPIYKQGTSEEKITNVLQDIHYTPEHGLFFIPLTDGEKRICRVTPEQIEAADETTPIMPKEMFVPADSNIREIESLADNGKGLMFFINHSYEEDGDRVKQILGVKFLKDTV